MNIKLKTEKTMKIQFEILNQDMMNILNQLAKIEPMNIAEYKAIIIKDFVDSNFFELVKKIKQSHEKGKKSIKLSIQRATAVAIFEYLIEAADQVERELSLTYAYIAGILHKQLIDSFNPVYNRELKA